MTMFCARCSSNAFLYSDGLCEICHGQHTVTEEMAWVDVLPKTLNEIYPNRCPACSDDAYVGFSHVECSNSKCKYYVSIVDNATRSTTDEQRHQD